MMSVRKVNKIVLANGTHQSSVDVLLPQKPMVWSVNGGMLDGLYYLVCFFDFKVSFLNKKLVVRTESGLNERALQ